jgi:hypothetical protein
MKTFKQFVEDISYFLDDRLVCEMANMQPKDTGLHPIVHVMSKGGAKHGPRVKVSNVPGTFNPDHSFTITAEHEPRIIGKPLLSNKHVEDIKDWVKLNHDHIHKVWHDATMTGTEVDAGFKKLN